MKRTLLLVLLIAPLFSAVLSNIGRRTYGFSKNTKIRPFAENSLVQRGQPKRQISDTSQDAIDDSLKIYKIFPLDRKQNKTTDSREEKNSRRPKRNLDNPKSNLINDENSNRRSHNKRPTEDGLFCSTPPGMYLEICKIPGNHTGIMTSGWRDELEPIETYVNTFVNALLDLQRQGLVKITADRPILDIVTEQAFTLGLVPNKGYSQHSVYREDKGKKNDGMADEEVQTELGDQIQSVIDRLYEIMQTYQGYSTEQNGDYPMEDDQTDTE